MPGLAPAPEPPVLGARHLATRGRYEPEEIQEVEEVEVPVIRRTPQRRRRGFAPWSFISPGFLALSLGLAACPWVEVRCEGGAAGGRTFASQSGYQAVYGGVSVDPLLEANARGEVERARRLDGKSARRRKDPDPSTDPAPLVGAGLLALVLALLCSLTILPTGPRVAFIVIFTGIGLVCLTVQLAIRFPLEKQLMKRIEELRARELDSTNDEAATLAAAMFTVRCSAWFWVSLTSALAAIVAAIADGIAGAFAEDRARRAYY
jgi:hypothetical protein